MCSHNIYINSCTKLLIHNVYLFLPLSKHRAALFNDAFVCVLCSARRVECREGLSGSAGAFVRAAESGEGQPAGGKHLLSSDRKTDAAGQGGMFCFLFSNL